MRKEHYLMFQIKELTPEMDLCLQNFCKKCEELGYMNNTFSAMKYEWLRQQGGIWHCVSYGGLEAGYGDILSLAGCHPLPEVNDNAWRVMFRGVQLPGHYGFGLSKYHMNALTWRHILPKQLEFIGEDKEIYITTNMTNDASGKMNKTHRLFQRLKVLGMVEHHRDMELYFTRQSVWKLNREMYMEVRANVV